MSPAQPGTSPPTGSFLRRLPPLCPRLPQSDGAEGARRVPRPAPLGNGRLRQPRRAGGWRRRRRPQAGRGFFHGQMHLQVPQPPDHPHLRLLQAFPGRGMAPRRGAPQPSRCRRPPRPARPAGERPSAPGPARRAQCGGGKGGGSRRASGQTWGALSPRKGWRVPPRAPGGGGQVGTAPGRRRRDPPVRVGAGRAPRVAGRRQRIVGLPARRPPPHACQRPARLSPRRGEAEAPLCPSSSQVLGAPCRCRGHCGTGASRCPR